MKTVKTVSKGTDGTVRVDKCPHHNLKDATYIDGQGRIRYSHTYCTDCGQIGKTLDNLPLLDQELRISELEIMGGDEYDLRA